jgi:GNAT superfamily N-acetyltransferase
MKPEFIRFLPLPPQTMESAAQFVEQAVANGQPDPKGDWLFAIQIKEEPRLIGTIRIGVRSTEHRQGDLGYAVHPDHWGKGFATEALRRILEFGASAVANHALIINRQRNVVLDLGTISHLSVSFNCENHIFYIYQISRKSNEFQVSPS